MDLRRAVLHELVDFQVAELVARSRAALESAGIDSVEKVRAAYQAAGGGRGARIVEHAPSLSSAKKQLEKFLFQRVYRSDRVMAVRTAVQQKLTRLFSWYCDNPSALPPGFRHRAEQFGVPRSVADYIAGMTDRRLG
jgi:dGTPase